MYFLHVLLSVTLLFQWYLEEIVAHRDLLAVSAVVYNCIPLNPSPSCLAPTHKERDVLLTIGKFSVLKFFHYVSFLWNALNFKLNWCSHLESGICEHQKVITRYYRDHRQVCHQNQCLLALTCVCRSRAFVRTSAHVLLSFIVL